MDFRVVPSEFHPTAYWVEFRGEIVRSTPKLSKSQPTEGRWQVISSWPCKTSAEAAAAEYRRLAA